MERNIPFDIGCNINSDLNDKFINYLLNIVFVSDRFTLRSIYHIPFNMKLMTKDKIIK